MTRPLQTMTITAAHLKMTTILLPSTTTARLRLLLPARLSLRSMKGRPPRRYGSLPPSPSNALTPALSVMFTLTISVVRFAFHTLMHMLWCV